MLVLAVAKAEVFDLKQRGGGRLRRRQRLRLEPGLQPRRIGIIQRDRVDMRRVFVRRDVNTGIPHGRQVERLTDAVFRQQRAGKQLIRMQVGQDPAVIDQHDAVHAAPKHILQTMLNDQDRGVGFLLYRVDQLNGLLAGGRVQIGERFIKQQHLDLIDHNARQTDALLLPAGKLVRCIVEVVFDPDQLCGTAGDLVHFLLRGAAVFQRKGNVLPHGQPYELAVRVLQHGAHMPGQLKDTAVGRVNAVHNQTALAFAGVGEGIQTVDAGRQCAFAAAGRTCNQHALARVDVQINVVQGWLLLRAVLEGKITEGYDRGFGFSHTAPRRVMSQAKSLPAFVGRHTGFVEVTLCPESPSWRWSWCRPESAGRRPQQP